MQAIFLFLQLLNLFLIIFYHLALRHAGSVKSCTEIRRDALWPRDVHRMLTHKSLLVYSFWILMYRWSAENVLTSSDTNYELVVLGELQRDWLHNAAVSIFNVVKNRWVMSQGFFSVSKFSLIKCNLSVGSVSCLKEKKALPVDSTCIHLSYCSVICFACIFFICLRTPTVVSCSCHTPLLPSVSWQLSALSSALSLSGSFIPLYTTS